jgi:hypothetical protein
MYSGSKVLTTLISARIPDQPDHISSCFHKSRIKFSQSDSITTSCLIHSVASLKLCKHASASALPSHLQSRIRFHAIGTASPLESLAAAWGEGGGSGGANSRLRHPEIPQFMPPSPRKLFLVILVIPTPWSIFCFPFPAVVFVWMFFSANISNFV